MTVIELSHFLTSHGFQHPESKEPLENILEWVYNTPETKQFMSWLSQLCTTTIPLCTTTNKIMHGNKLDASLYKRLSSHDCIENMESMQIEWLTRENKTLEAEIHLFKDKYNALKDKTMVVEECMYDLSRELNELDLEILALENEWRVGTDKISCKSKDMNRMIESLKNQCKLSTNPSTSAMLSQNYQESLSQLKELHELSSKWIDKGVQDMNTSIQSLVQSALIDSELKFELNFLISIYSNTQLQLLQAQNQFVYMSEKKKCLMDLPSPNDCLIQDDYESDELDLANQFVKEEMEEAIKEIENVLGLLGPLDVSSPIHGALYDLHTHVYGYLEDNMSLIYKTVQHWNFKNATLVHESQTGLDRLLDNASSFVALQEILSRISKQHGSLKTFVDLDSSGHLISSNDPLVEYLNSFLHLYEKEESVFMLSVDVVKESFSKKLKEWEYESKKNQELFQSCHSRALELLSKEQEIVQLLMKSTHSFSQLQEKEQLDFEYKIKSKIQELQPILGQLANLN